MYRYGGTHLLGLLALAPLHLDEPVGLHDEVDDVLLAHRHVLTLFRQDDGQALVLGEDRRNQEEDQQQEGDIGHGRSGNLVADLRLLLVENRHV